MIFGRVPDDVLKDIFGPDFEQRVAQIVDWSGGCPRDIVRILRECVARAPVTATALTDVLMSEGDSYRRVVTEDVYSHLVQVAHRAQLFFSEGNREMVEMMFANNLVLSYKSGCEWFDVHPALLDWPEFKREVDEKSADGGKSDEGDED